MGYGILIKKKVLESYEEGSFDATLLWTNPNPESSYAAQTLNIDFRDYEYLWIFSKNINTDTNNAFNSPTIAGKLINVRLDTTYTNFGHASVINAGIRYDGTYNYFCKRLATPNANKQSIAFTTGYYISFKNNTTSNMSSGSGTQYCIPYKIYGVNRNKKGKIQNLCKMDHTGGSPGHYVTWIEDEEPPNIVLPKEYEYISVECWQRNEKYTPYWNWEDNWFALNGQNTTRGMYVPSGKTEFISGNCSCIMKKGDTRLIIGGTRYESSMDCTRFREYSFDGKVLSATVGYGCNLYGRGSSNYYLKDYSNTSGIETVFGLKTALW